MHLINDVDDTLRRWPGALPAPAFSWWPDWLRRTGDELRALTVMAVALHRARASRMQLLQELERLDDRLLLDIGIPPGTLRRVRRVNLGQWLPNPWR